MDDLTAFDIFNTETYKIDEADHPAPGWAVKISMRETEIDLVLIENFGYDTRVDAIEGGLRLLADLHRGVQRGLAMLLFQGKITDSTSARALLRSVTHAELRALLKLGQEPEKPKDDHRSKSDQARDAVGNFAQYMAKSGCVTRSDVLRLVKHFHIDLLAAVDKIEGKT